MNLLIYLADHTGHYPVNASSIQRGVEVWKPSWNKVVPRGLSAFPFAVFWLFHYFRIFSNREYAVLLIREGKRIVHRSTISPPYFRFPFMLKHDVQIGSWTDPEYRGRGLARTALNQALTLTLRRSGRLWYIVREDNHASVHLATTSNLVLVARGSRVSRLGLGILGKFVLDDASASTQMTVRTAEP